VCTTAGCPIVYFEKDGHAFDEKSLRIPFGLKGTSKPMTVCYCFAHAAEDIHEEIARTGQTSILDNIKMEMKEIGCRCESENPLGTCCLETVKAVIANTQESLDVTGGVKIETDSQPIVTCCSSIANNESSDQHQSSNTGRAGLFAAVGSVAAAALSFACCWLPLVLIAFGVSAGGVAGFFVRWRIPLIAVAVLMLGLGFYFLYGRKTCCSSETRNPASRKMFHVSQAILWIATLFVSTMIFFPNDVNRIIRSSTQAQASTIDLQESITLIIPIEGMTCEGCESIVHQALIDIPEVMHVRVSFEKKNAVIKVSRMDSSIRTKMIEKINQAGYTTDPDRITTGE